MKEATGEVSMTVVTIVVVALILAIGTMLFKGNDSLGSKWIQNLFNSQISSQENGY